MEKSYLKASFEYCIALHWSEAFGDSAEFWQPLVVAVKKQTPLTIIEHTKNRVKNHFSAL